MNDTQIEKNNVVAQHSPNVSADTAVNGQTGEVISKSKPVNQEIFSEMMSASITMMEGNSKPNPITEKLTDEHLTAIIENQRQNDDRSYKLEHRSQWFRMGYIIIGIIAAIFLIVFLINYPEILREVLIAAFGFLGGMGTNAAYTNSKNKE